MDLTYFRGPDGAVYANLGPAWPGFNELLADAISPLPPLGSDERSLSTYWVDRAIDEIRRRRAHREDGAIQGGNSTTLVLSGSQVVARSDYELFDDEVMPVDDFVDVLQRWRSQIIAVRHTEQPLIPDTYRRNPYPS